MFSFIDPASTHSAALSHFHDYAMFFLILVIVFVVWLLKMIFKFVILEKDLKQAANVVSSSKIPHVNYIVWVLVNAIPTKGVRQYFFDLYAFVLITKNIKKTYYSFSLIRTIYPDQGKTVNVFLMLPSLVSNVKSFRKLYPSGNLVHLYTQTYHEYLSSLLVASRTLVKNVSFLFPYERVEIKSHGPYSSVKKYRKTNLYVCGFILAVKHLSYAKNLASHHFFKKWKLARLNVKDTFGFSRFGIKPIYKTYSLFSLPFLTFINFFSTDSRMFFYMFFQHVRHRKFLEWVWTCLPALILLLLLYPSLILLYCYDRPYITKPYLTFKAIGHQWYWSYEYSDFVTSTDQEIDHIKFDSYMLHQEDLGLGVFRLLEVDRRIVLPIGICARLITTSSDVLHSWAVPALGVKIDAVPGRLNQFWIVSDRPGTFYGQCSEICGVNHGFMPIAVEGAQFLDFFRAIAKAYAEA